MTAERLALRSYWYVRRKPFVEIDGDTLRIRTPAWFKSDWSIPLAELAFIDLRNERVALDEEAHDGIVIPAGLLVPYLFTTGPVTSPTTVLVFRTPQPVPPVKLVGVISPNSALPVGYRESRSAEGAPLDGCGLRFADPVEAHRALARAGVPSLIDPAKWFIEHRRVASPSEADEVRRQHRLLAWIGRTRYVFFGLFILSTLVMPDSVRDSNWAFSLSMSLFALAILVPMLAVRVDRKRRREQLERSRRFNT